MLNSIEQYIAVKSGWTEEEAETGCVVCNSEFFKDVQVVQNADDLMCHANDEEAAQYYAKLFGAKFIQILPDEIKNMLPHQEFYLDTPENNAALQEIINQHAAQAV